MGAAPPAMPPPPPPKTGPSTKATPFSAKRRPMSRAARGEMVLISTATRPGAGWLATPCSPSITSATSGLSATMEITRSQRAPKSAGLSPALAPASSKGVRDSGRRAQTVSLCPPLRRLRAMGRPMMPRPIKPMCIGRLLRRGKEGKDGKGRPV